LQASTSGGYGRAFRRDLSTPKPNLFQSDLFAMEGNLMKKKQPTRGQRRSMSGQGGMLSLLVGAPALCASLALILLVSAPGCVNRRLIELQRGRSCSSENVGEYAKAHGMSYEQALAERRKQDQADWEYLEERKRNSRDTDREQASATVVPEIPQYAEDFQPSHGTEF
jgi:hypothetical protein